MPETPVPETPVPDVPGLGRAVEDLAARVAALRRHCVWHRALTHESLVQYLVEEAHELVDAIEDGNEDELRGELGDMLLQVVLHARLAEEDRAFSLIDVVGGLSDKLIRRNPHVFAADGTVRPRPASLRDVEERYAEVKRREKHGARAKPGRRPVDSDRDPFSGIPTSLPALALAAKTVRRARQAGLDDGWPVPRRGHPISGEGEDVHSREPSPSPQDALGDALLEMVRNAVGQGLDPEQALRSAVHRYTSACHESGPAGHVNYPET